MWQLLYYWQFKICYFSWMSRHYDECEILIKFDFCFTQIRTKNIFKTLSIQQSVEGAHIKGKPCKRRPVSGKADRNPSDDVSDAKLSSFRSNLADTFPRCARLPETSWRICRRNSRNQRTIRVNGGRRFPPPELPICKGFSLWRTSLPLFFSCFSFYENEPRGSCPRPWRPRITLIVSSWPPIPDEHD